MKKAVLVAGAIAAAGLLPAEETRCELEFALPEPWRNGPGAVAEKVLLAELPGIAAITLSRLPSHIRIDWRWDRGIAGAGNLSAIYPAIPENGSHRLVFALDPAAGIFNGTLDGVRFRRETTRVTPWNMGPLPPVSAVKTGRLTTAVKFRTGRLTANPEPPPERLDLSDRRGRLIYHNGFDSPEACSGWRMEGPGRVELRNRELRMQPQDLKDPHAHFVYWCPENFPSDFLAEWTMIPESRYGLAIVFFAARGVGGQSVLAPELKPRHGVFSQYTQSDVAAYHISYYANTPDDPGRMTTNLRKNPGFYLLSNGPAPLPYGDNRPHRIQLLKEQNRIIMTVDGQKIIDCTDDGGYGEPWRDGAIGFRQMAHSVMRYSDFCVFELK